MSDDWRIHITVSDGDEGFLDRLGFELGVEARELARELEERRLAVSRDGDEIFVYADTQASAAKAHDVIEAAPRGEGLEATTSTIEHWLNDQERCGDEPADNSPETDDLHPGDVPKDARRTAPSHPPAPP